MTFDDVAARVGSTLYTGPQRGRIFYDMVLEHRPEQCLELGFAHGESSAYFAAALEALGRGHLTAVDLEESRDFTPSIETTLERAGVRHRVSVVRERTGYPWFLKKKIEECTRDGVCTPVYDLCFIDGSKNWTIDGCAFFLVDKLLKPGGWVIFDDYSFTYAEYEARTGKTACDGVNHRDLSDEEREEPHVEAIFRNLVVPHPDYSNFRVLDDSIAFAQKVRSEVKSFRLDTNASLKYKLIKVFRRLRRPAGA